MTLTPGTRLGVFELADLLGRGGMGDVYRATDNTLETKAVVSQTAWLMISDGNRKP